MDIHVSNLPENLALDKIKSLFSDFGSVLKVSYVKDADGTTDKTACIVSMRDEERAKAAIERLDGHSINGQSLQVNAMAKKLNTHRRRRRIVNSPSSFQSSSSPF